MTNAATGNPMIPTHPSIAAQHSQGRSTPGAAPNAAPNPSTPEPSGMDIDWDALMAEPQPPAPAPNGQSQAAPGGGEVPEGPAELTPEQKYALATEAMEAEGQPSAQPDQQQVTPEQIATAAVQHLLNTTYKLTDEQKKQLISEPDVAIPQLAAQMHVQIATQIGQAMQQVMQEAVPKMALAAMSRQMGAFKAEQQFFGQYPSLNDPRFRGTVLKSLKMAKAMNPQADRATIMREAAELAAFKLKVSLGGQQQQNQSAQPQAPQQRRQPTMPFTPATAAAPPAPSMQPQPETNIFAELAGDPDW